MQNHAISRHFYFMAGSDDRRLHIQTKPAKIEKFNKEIIESLKEEEEE